MTGYLILLIAVLVLGLGYALLPQVYSLGLDDREPVAEGMQVKRLREEKEKWIQGILDLDTEWEVGNLEEDEYHSLRRQYKRNANEALQTLEQLEAEVDEDVREQDLDEAIEASIEEKKEQFSNQN